MMMMMMTSSSVVCEHTQERKGNHVNAKEEGREE
jgi:hypothetical protein